MAWGPVWVVYQEAKAEQKGDRKAHGILCSAQVHRVRQEAGDPHGVFSGI